VAEAGGASVRVVAGEFGGVRGPVTEIAANPLYMDVTLEPGAEFAVAAPAGHTAVAYLFEGAALFGADVVEAVRLAVFDDGDEVRAQAGPGGPARFMLMAGQPFGEPIAPYGPFVMNTRAEIMQALADLRNGTFVS
jgi:redox-sensitive bicupin YhaK (pirin superfamily)